jgi:hypothetical protein
MVARLLGLVFRKRFEFERVNLASCVSSFSLRIREINDEIARNQNLLRSGTVSYEQEVGLKVIIFRLEDDRRACERCLSKALDRISILERRLGIKRLATKAA